ncbi:MAG: hypothetical protein WDN72_09150 [Alphaproteobacteria bacterium]
MPIWRVPESDESPSRAQNRKSTRNYRKGLADAGLLRTAKDDAYGTNDYAPVFTPNINFRPDDPNSLPFRFCRPPFVMLNQRRDLRQAVGPGRDCDPRRPCSAT